MTSPKSKVGGDNAAADPIPRDGRFAVALGPQDPVSVHLHGLRVGDAMEFKGALPVLPYRVGQYTTLGLIAGGPPPPVSVARHGPVGGC